MHHHSQNGHSSIINIVNMTTCLGTARMYGTNIGNEIVNELENQTITKSNEEVNFN